MACITLIIYVSNRIISSRYNFGLINVSKFESPDITIQYNYDVINVDMGSSAHGTTSPF